MGLIPTAKALGWFYSLLSLGEAALIEKRYVPMPEQHIESAIRYMEENYRLKIKIKDVADSLHVDDRYLYNIFMDRLGVSPKDYLSSLRIERAKQLLALSTLSVGEVGASVGYEDILAFSAFFKKKTGKSPSEYRKEGG